MSDRKEPRSAAKSLCPDEEKTVPDATQIHDHFYDTPSEGKNDGKALNYIENGSFEQTETIHCYNFNFLPL